ncbi:MAG: hypothetical protein IT368_04425, partial [Candidatus Hydrogenedentes bacterium]|nr:hypothetical protein [Candidatus Hydrogenedentota bacterium]
MHTFALVLIGLAIAAPSNHVLKSESDVWDMAVSDMNGDGLRDILLLACDSKSHPLQKTLHLYLASEDSAYAESPSASQVLHPRTGALQLAEVTGAPPRELVAFDASGATVYAFADGAFSVQSEPKFSSLLPSGAREPIFLKEAEDLDGDGVDEWLVPQADGYAVRHAGGVEAEIACDVVSEIRRNGSIYVYHRLPAMQTFVQSDSPVKGLAFLSDEFADFAYGPNWSQSERFKVPVNLEDKW